ncbi:hypothetical protein [Calothrix sp. UHCC 0171]|uniref:hypothetical protein n=1 Tax=Calothrix sp. UHCC 0171 TaxID=3110245 RepID=UPI002B1EEAF1|nr:hypothetical protein [Calothrix sp. UHCC 0171]MEA5571031.1 hypothetical protein [Calothrix sp. UHCC 0171]
MLCITEVQSNFERSQIISVIFFVDNSKYPTMFVFLLDENGKYHRNQFPANGITISLTFPNLKFTVEEIFKT